MPEQDDDLEFDDIPAQSDDDGQDQSLDVPSRDEEPDDESVKFIEGSLTDKVLDKLGLVRKDQFDAVSKSRNDNQRAFRRERQQHSDRLATLERKLDGLSSRDQQAAAPTSQQLWAKYHASGEFEDLEAARVTDHRELEAGFDRKLQESQKKIIQETSAAGIEREWSNTLALAENKDLDLDSVADYLDETGGGKPDESVFIYRFRKWAETNKGGIQGYVNSLARNLARARPGAITAPAGTGSAIRGSSRVQGRRLSNKELLDDYEGRQ